MPFGKKGSFFVAFGFVAASDTDMAEVSLGGFGGNPAFLGHSIPRKDLGPVSALPAGVRPLVKLPLRFELGTRAFWVDASVAAAVCDGPIAGVACSLDFDRG